MIYRPWTYEDILEIAALEKECFSDPWSYQMLAETFCSGNVVTVAAESGERVVGYAFAALAGEDADVANIAVAPEQRRRGIAENMLGALLDAARAAGVKKVFLEVRVSNAPAMALYLKQGFRGVYARPRYYADGEDALVMVRTTEENAD